MDYAQLRFILKQLDTNVFIQLQLPPLFVGLSRYGHRQSVLLQRQWADLSQWDWRNRSNYKERQVSTCLFLRRDL